MNAMQEHHHGPSTEPGPKLDPSRPRDPDHDLGHAGGMHHDHGDHVGQFRRLFWLMLVLALPTAYFSEMFASILGYSLPEVGRWL